MTSADGCCKLFPPAVEETQTQDQADGPQSTQKLPYTLPVLRHDCEGVLQRAPALHQLASGCLQRGQPVSVCGEL